MYVKLFDSELKVMEILWRSGDTTARDIAEELEKTADWSKTTTYTVIKKCVNKGAVSRSEPNFICHAEISRRERRSTKQASLLTKCTTVRQISLWLPCWAANGCPQRKYKT